MIAELRGGILAMVLTGLLSGCGGLVLAPVEERRSVPESYVVVRGDTLYAIAWRYGLDYKQVAAWNWLNSPDLIYAGQRLRLRPPGALAQSSPPAIELQGRSTRSAPPKAKPAAEPVQRGYGTSQRVADTNQVRTATPERIVDNMVWRWPAQGQIMRGYQPDVPGHKGIHISGSVGQPIGAASEGQVVYSGSGLPGYGRLIIVKHSDTLLSAYGYLGKIFVREGDNVRVGQPIAELGTSNGTRPVLHFEIRQNGKPVDPLHFLPG